MPGETSEQATVASDPLRSREGKGGAGDSGCGMSVQLGVTVFYHFGQKLFSDPLVPNDIGPFVTNVGERWDFPTVCELLLQLPQGDFLPSTHEAS